MRDEDGILLETQGLVKSFGGLRATDGLNLSVARGDIRCVIGPNGAGKSTFFKLLIGMYRPDAGAIRFEGRDISRLQPFERARLGIGIKWQASGIYHELSVRHNMTIALQRRVKGAHLEQEMDRLLRQLNLSDSAEALAGRLSHGAQQWLEMGMVLAMKPKLMLLDEPTAGMSPEETRATAELLKAVNAEGVTVLVTEHDMAFVRHLDAEVIVLHEGRVFAQGRVGDIEAHADVRRIYLGTADIPAVEARA